MRLIYLCTIASLLLLFCLACKPRPTAKSLTSNGIKVDNPNDPIYQSTVAIVIKLTEEERKSSEKTLPENITICSGTLISKRHVLTAAHCFYSENQSPEFSSSIANKDIDLAQKSFFIATGSDQSSSISELNRYEIVDVQFPRPFENAPFDFIYPGGDSFDSVRGNQHDVAIVSLDRDVSLPFRAANLPKQNVNAAGRNVVSAGFGITGKSDTFDSGILRKVKYKTPSLEQTWRRAFCAKPISDGFLPGDSGGPAYDESTHEVVGITSYIGFQRCFTDVHAFLAWIQKILEQPSNVNRAQPIYEFEQKSSLPIVATTRGKHFCWIRDFASVKFDVKLGPEEPCSKKNLEKLYQFVKTEEEKAERRKIYYFPGCETIPGKMFQGSLSSQDATHTFSDMIYGKVGPIDAAFYFTSAGTMLPTGGNSSNVAHLIIGSNGCPIVLPLSFYADDIQGRSLSITEQQETSLFYFSNDQCKKVVVSKATISIDGLEPCSPADK